jgi:HPt (histidine-containing phosphotransfer) domain-containing protein
MSLQTCYAALGGDYEGTLGRFLSEPLLQKFVLKFLDDGSFALLLRSLDENDYQEAFRAAHTLKGVSQNLGFTPLQHASGRLAEALRPGAWTPELEELTRQVEVDYRQTVSAIRAYQEEKEA